MNKLAKFGAAVSASLTAIMLMATGAYAQTDYSSSLSGVTTEVDSAKSAFVTWVTTTGIVVLFTLTVVGIGIRLGLKYLKRGARAA